MDTVNTEPDIGDADDEQLDQMARDEWTQYK